MELDAEGGGGVDEAKSWPAGGGRGRDAVRQFLPAGGGRGRDAVRQEGVLQSLAGQAHRSSGNRTRKMGQIHSWGIGRLSVTSFSANVSPPGLIDLVGLTLCAEPSAESLPCRARSPCEHDRERQQRKGNRKRALQRHGGAVAADGGSLAGLGPVRLERGQHHPGPAGLAVDRNGARRHTPLRAARDAGAKARPVRTLARAPTASHAWPGTKMGCRSPFELLHPQGEVTTPQGLARAFARLRGHKGRGRAGRHGAMRGCQGKWPLHSVHPSRFADSQTRRKNRSGLALGFEDRFGKHYEILSG